MQLSVIMALKLVKPSSEMTFILQPSQQTPYHIALAIQRFIELIRNHGTGAISATIATQTITVVTLRPITSGIVCEDGRA